MNFKRLFILALVALAAGSQVKAEWGEGQREACWKALKEIFPKSEARYEEKRNEVIFALDRFVLCGEGSKEEKLGRLKKQRDFFRNTEKMDWARCAHKKSGMMVEKYFKELNEGLSALFESMESLMSSGIGFAEAADSDCAQSQCVRCNCIKTLKTILV